MALFKASTSRRREVRKALPRQRWALWHAATRAQALWGLGLVLLFIVLAAAVVLDGRSQPVYRVGQFVDRTQISRVSFQALDRIKTEEARKRAYELAPAIYVPNETFLTGTEQRLRTLPSVAGTVEYENLAEDVQKSFALTRPAYEALKEFQAEGEPTEAWVSRIEGLVSALGSRAVLLDTERYQVEKQNLARTIRLANPQGPEVTDRNIFNVGDEAEIRRALHDSLTNLPAPIQETIVSYFVRSKEPTHRYDAPQTERAKSAAQAAALPAFARYERNSILIPAGEWLTADGQLLLQREQQEYLSELPRWAKWMYYAGPLLLLVVIAGATAMGVSVLRPRIVQNPMRGLAMAGLLLATLGLAWAARPMSPYATPAAVLAPTVLTAVILAVAYDPRLAAAVAALHAILICVALRQGLGLYVVTLFACLIAVVQLAEVRKRGRLIRMGFVTGVLAGIGVLVVGLSERQYLPDNGQGVLGVVSVEAMTAGVTAVAVGFFVLGALPSIERTFKVTTSMTLLELADMDHPLLRRLSQAAPGTFNHSLQVATLAEAGAEAIGANGLLARVGAYYHDIGKIHKPAYFVENQSGGTNRHEKLSPAMSLLIIVAHVKDGVEMAREYALPTSLIHFIESHHGTTLVEYFYHAAKRSRDERQQPEEIEFRYPGPKPQSKEAAVVMVCDAAESACRALADPTPTRIEQLVQKLVSKRLLDGQFDECEITLNELRIVEEAVTKALASIYHGRMAYPGEKKVEKVEPRKTQPNIEERVAG